MYIGAHGKNASFALMGINKNKSSAASYNAKSTRKGFTVKPQAVLSASYNPKSLNYRLINLNK